jgi:hypothetical protein
MCGSLGIALLLGGIGAGCGGAPAGENTESTSEHIVGGTPISTTTMDSLALVNIQTSIGLCSGTLLTPFWALTAEHCMQNVGQSTAPAFNSVSVQLASGSGVPVPSDAIYMYGQHDVALVHLSSGIPINGSFSFTNTLSSKTPSELVGQTLSCFGRGASSFPVNNAGVWRTANFSVSSSQDDGYTMQPNALGQADWVGDSGGPCFLNGQITGIESSGTFNCGPLPPGVTQCTSQFANQITSMTQASASFAATWAADIMKPTPLHGAATGGLSVIQSSYGNKGNFELVAPAPSAGFGGGQGLVHYYRNNDETGVPWIFDANFGTEVGMVNGAVVRESTWNTLEVIATAGSQLYSFWKPINGGWQATYAIPGANHERGTPGFWQSTFTPKPGSPGNFEVAVPSSSGGIDYFWRDNSISALPWHFAGTIYQSLGLVDDVVLYESKSGSMEMAARVGLSVYVMTRSAPSSSNPFIWGNPTLMDSTAIGRPSYFQSNYGQTGNYELLVPSSQRGFNEYWRNNDVAGTPWTGPVGVFTGSGFFYTAASAFESNWGPAPGNIELYGINGTEVHQGWREDQFFDTTCSGCIGVGGFVPTSDLRFIGPLLIISNR